jgi:hypothetical protein
LISWKGLQHIKKYSKVNFLAGELAINVFTVNLKKLTIPTEVWIFVTRKNNNIKY